MSVLTPGALASDLVYPLDGAGVENLWSHRQRSHVLLVVQPDKARRQELRQQFERDHAQWTWLHVAPRIAPYTDPPVSPGAYAFDRYGHCIHHWPGENWSLEEIQQEFLYFDARHC